MARKKFAFLEAIVFDPSWNVEAYPEHPLTRGEIVYWMGDIPNVDGHCCVAKTFPGGVVSMVHSDEFRKAKEDEL